MSTRRIIRELRAAGWSVRHTGAGHLELRHPEADRPIYTGTSPSDRRARNNLTASLRRALRAGRGERAQQQPEHTTTPGTKDTP